MMYCFFSVKAQNAPESNFKGRFQQTLIYLARDLGYEEKDFYFATFQTGNVSHPG